MKLGMLVAAALFAAGSLGCAAGSQTVVRSPGFMSQPVGRAVLGHCFVEDAVHTIRHAVSVTRVGQLAVTADVKEGTLNAEILLKDPSGAYVQHLVTTPAQRSYTLNLLAQPGDWEIVVVCRKGTASYTVQADVAPPLMVGAAR